MTSQLRRAAVSIASNIVEGCARFSESEYIHFLDVAYGSSREVEYQIGLSHRLGFLDALSHTELQQVATETAKVLMGCCVHCAASDQILPEYGASTQCRSKFRSPACFRRRMSGRRR